MADAETTKTNTDTVTTTTTKPKRGRPPKSAKTAAERKTGSAVKIAIPQEAYETDDRSLYWLGLVDECPLDNADVSLGAPEDSSLEAFREYRRKFDGLKTCITLSKQKRTWIERRGVKQELPTAGGFEYLSDREYELFIEALGKLGVLVEHDDEGELRRAYPPRRLRVGDQPLAQWVFIEPVDEDNLPSIGATVATPIPLQIESA